MELHTDSRRLFLIYMFLVKSPSSRSSKLPTFYLDRSIDQLVCQMIEYPLIIHRFMILISTHWNSTTNFRVPYFQTTTTATITMFFPLSRDAKFGKKPVALLATQVLCVSNERTLSSANQNHRAHRIRADLGCIGVPSKKSVSVSLYQKCNEKGIDCRPVGMGCTLW